MHDNIQIMIPTPNDSHKTHSVLITVDKEIFRSRTESISLGRTTKDPIHTGLQQFFSKLFRKRRTRRYTWDRMPEIEYPILLSVGSCPLYIERNTNRFSINGQATTLEIMTNAIARLAFKAAFEVDALKLMPFFNSILSMPEEVRYVIENRVPYHFYSDYVRHDVRLNVTQISDKECAIEIGDGIWGNITIKELKKLCNFYVNSRKMGGWAYTSPENLYIRLLGKKPTQSDLKVMIAFLKQNRTQDIVERRAEKLVAELLEQYPKQLRGMNGIGGKVTELLVRGKDYDWKLSPPMVLLQALRWYLLMSGNLLVLLQ